MDEVKIWAIDDTAKVEELKAKGQMDDEWSFEDTLVKNPNLLMPGLTLVGRQTPTEGGPLDLLGVDSDGKLAVFELKRGALSREAVAQVIDYASDLGRMELGALAEHISERSGEYGITKIDDFEEWYNQQFPGQGLATLKRPRMFLVGLGADDTTERMVGFLANNSNMDISLLTFHGFVHNGKTLLAKQVQVEGASDSGEETRDPKRTLRNEFRELGADRLFDAARQMFLKTWRSGRYEYATKGRWNFQISDTAESGNPTYRVYFAIAPDVERRGIEVCSYPRAIDLSFDEFDQLDPEAVSFRRGSPWGQSTERVKEEILFPLNTYAEWDKHKEELTRLTSSVYESWLSRDQGEDPSSSDSREAVDHLEPGEAHD